MTDCERYRSDPDAYPTHVELCEECRRFMLVTDPIDRSVGELSLDPRPEFRDEVTTRLPFAPWEGAGYRSWGLVVAVLITLIVLVAGAFLAVGVNPIRAIATLGSAMLPLVSPFELARSFAATISSAPVKFHITIGVAFVVVNLVLIFLLRRPPKGYDA